MYRDIIKTFTFVILLFSHLYSDTCDDCTMTEDIEIYEESTVKTVSRKCIPAKRAEVYDQKEPLFTEYGCENKIIGKQIYLNMIRAQLISTSVIVSTIISDPSYESYFIIFIPLFGLAVNTPVGILRGLLKGFMYDKMYNKDPDNFKARPFLGYSYTPAFSRTYNHGFTIFYRHFNTRFVAPDVYEIGYSLKEYINRNKETDGLWYVATVENYFASTEWRLTNKRCFNVYAGLKLGYSSGDCYNSKMLSDSKKISTPLVDLSCRYEFNALDVFTISLSTSYNIVGPMSDIKKWNDSVSFKDNASIYVSFGAFIF